MNNAHIRYQIKKLKDYLAIKTEMVNHQAIVREMASGVDHSWIYYLMLLMAGLIALFGLLTNSVAVVIGAMLISPLMGPIISSGLALIIGDLSLARRAFRTIAISVGLTILVTAVITVVSPLKDPTAEIMARVRPNIYDLFIAVLSGIVGTVALCTKRNYLITATGVAVATAVIPPLSVVGYGLGTGQVMLAMGGFLLFFTNFVAIVLTSYLVFFVMGFRTTHVETTMYATRKRIMIIAGLLFLISIPLIYTLVVDLKKVSAKKRIEQVLKKHLNKSKASRMTGFFFVNQNDKMQVNASVNTVKLIDAALIKQMEEALKNSFRIPVELQLEQLIVASEKLPVQTAQLGLLPGKDASTPKIETASVISAKVAGLRAQVEADLAKALAPFPVSDTRLSFSGAEPPLLISAKLHRDYPVKDDERLILARILQQSLGLPLTLTVSETTLFAALSFAKDGSIALETAKSLAVIKQLPGGAAEFRFLLEAPRNSGKQLAALQKYLIDEFNVPAAAIFAVRSSGKTVGDKDIKLRIVRHKESR